MARTLKSLKPEHFEAALEATLEAYPRGNAAGVFGACILLGQIVVDRASQAAYRMISDKIIRGLGCVDGEGVKNAGTVFPTTCEALVSLRIQELAMSRDILLRALTADVVRAGLENAFEQARTRLDLPAKREKVAALLLAKQVDAKALADAMHALSELEIGHGEATIQAVLRKAGVEATAIDQVSLGQSKDLPAALDLIKGTLLPLVIGTISNPTKERSGDAAHAIVAEIESLAASALGSVAEGQPWEPFVLAAAALVKCRARVAVGDLSTVGACNVSSDVDGLDGSVAAKKVARSLARSLQIALVGKSGDEPDPDRRLVAALSGVFDATCYAADMTKSLGCPALLDVAAADYGQALLPLSLARGMLEAAVERDTNRMIATAVAGTEVVIMPKLAASEGRGQKRALRLLAGVVAYAGTYQPRKPGESTPAESDSHAQRTKILESLMANMTSRQDREGDVIVSFGGSLALVGGVRAPFGDGTLVFNGPFALSLGFGLQNVPTDSPVGWHVELGLLDLAQYLSYEATPKDAATNTDSKVEVRTPEVKDAAAPSLKLGVQWGRDVPFFLAAGFGYAPFYEFKKADGTVDSRGAFTASATFGAYVPLIDIN